MLNSLFTKEQVEAGSRLRERCRDVAIGGVGAVVQQCEVDLLAVAGLEMNVPFAIGAEFGEETRAPAPAEHTETRVEGVVGAI